MIVCTDYCGVNVHTSERQLLAVYKTAFECNLYKMVVCIISAQALSYLEGLARSSSGSAGRSATLAGHLAGISQIMWLFKRRNLMQFNWISIQLKKHLCLDECLVTNCIVEL